MISTSYVGLSQTDTTCLPTEVVRKLLVDAESGDNARKQLEVYSRLVDTYGSLLATKDSVTGYYIQRAANDASSIQLLQVNNSLLQAQLTSANKEIKNNKTRTILYGCLSAVLGAVLGFSLR